MLKDKCSRANTVFNENDMHHFFGNYQASPQNFQILLGERKLLLAAAREINRLNESQSFADYLKFFAVPEKYTICNKNTDKFSVGLYFGKKNRSAVAQIPLSNEILVDQVFGKVAPVFNKFGDSGLKAVRNITKDIVKIVNFGTGIRADVICVFCTINDVNIEALHKTIAVQYEVKRGSTSGCWNVTNLKKHLQRHLMESSSKQLTQRKSKDSLQMDANNVESKLKINVVPQADTQLEVSQLHLDDAPSQSNNIQPCLNDSIIITLPQNERTAFFEQMSSQNLRMMRAALENNEQKNAMVVKIGDQVDTIDVLEIDPDGNCLLGTCVHQIHATKLGSKQHYDKVTAIRKEIVDHISNNFERYAAVLKFRIEEEEEARSGKRPNNVDESQCKKFVNEYLSRPGNWAGVESLMAISELYEVNVIGFNENEKYYFATGHNASYSRFIFIAYRLNYKSEYNHYNSVCGINPTLMYKCVSDLSKVVFDQPVGVQSL